MYSVTGFDVGLEVCWGDNQGSGSRCLPISHRTTITWYTTPALGYRLRRGSAFERWLLPTFRLYPSLTTMYTWTVRVMWHVVHLVKLCLLFYHGARFFVILSLLFSTFKLLIGHFSSFLFFTKINFNRPFFFVFVCFYISCLLFFSCTFCTAREGVGNVRGNARARERSRGICGSPNGPLVRSALGDQAGPKPQKCCNQGDLTMAL